VPFGSAWYGGGPHVVLYVSPRATDAELTADWTAVHEIFHATMPPIVREDAWFSEGVTTYYQEVLRARAGLQTPLEAWNELESGFRRGRADGNGLPLAQESREMYSNHAFHRVYWAGAALAFLLDVELRRERGGARSLDDAMGWIREIPGGLERSLRAEEAIAEIDAREGAPRFRRLAETWLARSEFPDLEAAQAWLGLVRGGDGRLSVAPAPGAAVRDAIMAR
jgi:predicted metalloprotease with PDZ domain